MDYDPWSYEIYVGPGHLVNQIISTKSAIYIAFLLPYCIILNHPITGSIMAMNLYLIFLSVTLFL